LELGEGWLEEVKENGPGAVGGLSETESMGVGVEMGGFEEVKEEIEVGEEVRSWWERRKEEECGCSQEL